MATAKTREALEKWEKLVKKVYAPSSTSILTHIASNLTSVPASLTPTSDINDILQVASEIEKENPEVSLLLCEHAYELARKLDPNSKGRGVLQFKAGLMSHIKQKMKDRTRLKDKSSTLQKFYDEYYEKHHKELDAEPPADSEGLKDRGIRRQKILMTMRVLLEAIKDDKPSKEVKDKMNLIAKYLGPSRLDNILPLEGPGYSMLLELPEVIAAREVLKMDIVYDENKQRREGEDIFDTLEAAFGFQRDNLRNQREHLVLLLANTQSQLWDIDKPKVNEKNLQGTLKKVCDKILENYKNWCSYVRCHCYYNGEMKDQMKVALVALYLCIWGEAANVRFLPECICYIFHKMAGELLDMLDKNVIHPSESCKRESGGPSFLEKIIVPVYIALKEEADKNKGGKAAHSKWGNYDDFNEIFWSNACLNQLSGWPSAKQSLVFRHKTGGGQKTSFVEHRTFFHLYHSFVRVWILLVMMLQGLLIVAFTESFSLRTLKILLSLGPTYFVMKLIESVLDIILMIGAYFNSRRDAIVRIFFQFLVYGGCTGGLSYLYWKMYWEEAPSDLFLRIYLWVLGSYVALKLLISLFQHIPSVRLQLEKMDKYRAVEALKWLFKEHFYVGRGLFERPRDYIRYVLFWVIVLACKFTFSYFFQIKPIADATKTIFFFEGEVVYAWHDFVSKNNHNALALFFLWAPVVLVYLLDVQIWYTVFSAILGGVIGCKDRLGEIRSLDMLRSRFEYFPKSFIKNLQHERSFNEHIAVQNEDEKLKTQVEYAYIYAPFWNDIIHCLREEDYISDHERDLLTMPTKKMSIPMLTERTSTIFVQWPLFLLAGKVLLAMKSVIDKKESLEDISDRLKDDKYMSSAVTEAFESVCNLLDNMVVTEPGRLFFKKVHDDVRRSIKARQIRSDFLIEGIENIHKKVTKLTALLTIDEQPQKQQLDEAVQNIFEAVLNILSLDLKREKYKDYSSNAAKVLFKNVNIPPKEMRDSIMRLHLLLTTTESGASIPKNGEAQRRLQFFTNSLFMRMPRAPSVRAMKSFSVLTPYVNEIVMFSIEDLQKNNEDGISTLFYLQKIFPDEWKNFLQRKNILEKVLMQHLQNPHSEFREELDLRLWASYRGQTLARTVRGMMYYRKALILQASLEEQDSKGIKRAMAAEGLADYKFTYVVSCQMYGQHKTSPRKEDNAKANDILHLLRVNEGLRVAFIDILDGQNDEKIFYSKLIKSGGGGIEQVIYSIRLPGNPRLGEGKPENQNHAVIFTRGEALQTIDMNQDNYFEEALKMRNLLEEFEAEHGINRPTILGVREHVFTGSVSSLAWFMSNQEESFVTLGQRVLARPLKVRMHYGHPDVFDRLFHLTRGGISKASKSINVSEDIFAGFNSTLRKGNVTHHEYIQVGKGRDVGLNQIAMFEAKVSSGNAEQLISRDVYRLGQLFDFFRMLSFYFTSVGYYVCTMMTVLVVYVFLYGKVYMALSGVGQSLKSSVSQNQALQAALDTQFLYQIGIFTAIPMLIVFLLEQGILKAIVNFITMQLQLCSVFFTFSLGTRTHYFGQTVLHGGARYHATGRGFVVQHIKFAYNYQLYSRSHFVKALEIVMLLLVIRAYGYDSSTLGYFLFSMFSWFLAMSWLFAPFIFNPSCFEWQKTVEDFDDWTNWLFHKAAVGVHTNDSWEAWWNQEQEHIRSPVGRALEILLSLRFFIFQFGVVYHLKAAHHSLSLNVYGVSWLVFAGIILIFLIFSFGPKFSVNYQMFLRLVQGTVFMIIAAGLVAVIALRIVNLEDICASLLALIPTGWGILSIGIACKPLIKSMGLWKSMRAIARAYDAAMGMIIFVPIAILSWFPFVSTFQTRLLFNQAFSRGLEISLILAGNRPTSRGLDISLMLPGNKSSVQPKEA